jgi:asparagine synthase (glutamine-hydrolysing)
MCGIVGKISLSSRDVTENQLKQMAQTIRYRGPDDSGIYISPDKKVGLGNLRLAIIDLSPLGHQPMVYKNRYWIAFNGEIYNFQSERRKLEKSGYKFKSKSDTEVILALYDKFGSGCLSHLRGMFAFAIYDTYKKTLFCARDRVGKKPFKYYFDGNTFIFASELKAILTQTEVKPTPDYSAIHDYLTLQYTPSPATGFTDIKKLEPGHYLFLDITKKTLSKERYWQLDFSQKLSLSEDEWCKHILDKLEESVKLRMISDVPLGAFLSGGVDSSAVVAMMAKNSNRPIKTFSIGFTESKFSELKYAKIVADRFNTDHTEFVVHPESVEEVLPLLVHHYEEPYADSSGLATYYVSKLTREHVTVALNGDGGDENFAGYPWYSIHQFSLFYEKFRFLNSLIAKPLWNAIYRNYPNTLTERGSRFSRMIDRSYSERYIDYIAYFPEEEKKKMYTSSFRSVVGNLDSARILSEKFKESGVRDKLDQALYTDINTYLPDDLLAKVDIASMAVSLEGRSPFLDHEFMEMSAKIPSGLKLKNLNTHKYILKKSLEGILPQEILNRPKMGFGVPISVWFKDDLKGYTQKMLLSKNSHILEFVKKDYVQNLLTQHQTSGINFSARIWCLLTLELWLESHF